MDQTDFEGCLKKIMAPIIENRNNNRMMDIEQERIVENIIQNNPQHALFPVDQ